MAMKHTAYLNCRLLLMLNAFVLVFEIVANSPFGHDLLRLGGLLLELLAQTAHVHVHRPYVALILGAPYRREKALARVDLAGDSPKRRISTLWNFMRRSLNQRSAFFVSKHLLFPKIWMFTS